MGAMNALYDLGVQSGQPVPDMLQRGNVDVNHRPSITNADGSKSSIYSMTVPVDKSGNPVPWETPNPFGYALVPSIANGRFLSADGKMPTTEAGAQQLEAAATEYYRKTKQHLGIFKSADSANQYATLNHDYGNNGTSAKVFAPSPSLSARMAYLQNIQNSPPPAMPSMTPNMGVSSLDILQRLAPPR